jgi:uncharacterized protein (DUF2062 family)
VGGMMNKWLQKCMPTAKSIQNSSQLSGLKPYLRDPSLWNFKKCDSVARGVAIGLFAAFLPILQMLIAALLAIFLRANLPLAVLLTWVSNPLTFIPITYATYFIGEIILGNGYENAVFQEMQWDFSSFHAFWSSFSVWTLQFGKAFFIGLPVLAISVSLIGYIVTILVWKVGMLLRKKKS